MTVSEKVAKMLLELNAVSLNPKKPFKYASGILSPVYTDCRVLMAYPDKRRLIRDLYIDAIKKSGVSFDVVAGTATAGIPHAAWISDKLNLPMVYVRGKAKDHGKENLMEGIIKKGQKVIVIEDLVSTGESAINSVNAVREAGGEIAYVFSIITYGLKTAEQNFIDNNLQLISLTTFQEVVNQAQKMHYIDKEGMQTVLDWTSDPKKFINPKQPKFVYDITKPWEEVVQEGPIWKSGKFPPLSKEKKYKFLGQKLISPIAISAGPASRKVWTDFYLKMGYGLVFEKTRRSTPRVSNKVPNVAIIQAEKQVKRKDLQKPLTATNNQDEFDKYLSITNSFGNPSPAIDVWAEELRRQKESVEDGQILGCSVTATIINPKVTTEDVVADLLIAATAAVLGGAQVVEFNLACPNVTENKEEGEMFQSAPLVKYLFSEFKKRFPKTKAGFKFGLYKSKDQMKKVFSEAGDNLDYVSGINAIAMTVLGRDGKEILPGRKVSGVCGKLIQDIALESIRWANEIRKEERLNYEILGGGGIVEVEDVDKFLKAGADMVQVATIAMVDPLFAYKYRLHKEK